MEPTRNPQLRKMIIAILESKLFPSEYISFEKLSTIITKAYSKIDKKITKDLISEELIGLLSDFFCYGKYNKIKQTKEPSIELSQLDKGRTVEMEHTGCWMIAERIAKDHLTEMEDYYDELEMMEGSKLNETLLESEVDGLLEDFDCGCHKG